MKHSTKLSKTLCLLVCLFMGSAFTAAAADFMVDSICYNIIGENQARASPIRSSASATAPFTPARI